MEGKRGWSVQWVWVSLVVVCVGVWMAAGYGVACLLRWLG